MYSPWQQSSQYKFHVSEIEMFQEMNFSHVSLESFNIWKLSKAQDAIFRQALAWKMIDDQLFLNLSTHTQSWSFFYKSIRAQSLQYNNAIAKLLIDFPSVFQIAASSKSNNKSTREQQNAAWKWATAGRSQISTLLCNISLLCGWWNRFHLVDQLTSPRCFLTEWLHFFLA